MRKHLLTLSVLLLTSTFCLYSQSITLTETVGWLESAYVKWQPVANATSYHVYYSGAGLSNVKIDNELIRAYSSTAGSSTISYYRADIPGIAPGSYTITVKPVINGAEQTGTTSQTITVLAQDRTGFAFDGGRIPGAYNSDGTLKSNAVVIYISQNNKNTISMNVTGASTNPCVGLQTILDGFKKGKDTRPLVVRLIGNITDLSYMLGGDVVVENNNNSAGYITFEGVGNDAVANGWGLRIKNASNVEVRNLGFMNCDSDEGDDVGLQQDNDHIWVHNCDMFYGNAGSDADQIKGDGSLDCKKSTYITFSYNHFWDNGKCNLLGLSEGTTSGLYITYHHNWYDHSDSRHPRVRYYSAHIYNNYFDGNSKYGSGSTLGSSLFVEGNYYRDCKHPMMISLQGTDVWNSSTQKNDPTNMGTFSGEDGGMIKAFNNKFDASNGANDMRFVPYKGGSSAFNIAGVIADSTDFDAYVVATRETQVPATVISKSGGNSYNNFDTNTSLYVNSMTADSPDDAKAKVLAYSGRILSGDFAWTFTNSSDDAAYAVNTGLKAALTSYTSCLVSIQDESTSGGSTGSQTLSLSSGSASQTVSLGTSITNIVYAWGGDAVNATVSGLGTSGLLVVKDSLNKTITIYGSPSSTTTYTVTTSGVSGTASSATGTITVTSTGTGSMTQNFTTDGKTSSFYSITGNLSTSYGSVVYSTLTLTQCLKMESSTSIAFTSTQSGTLTLVFNSAYTGTVKIDGTTYTPTSGLITATLAAGSHTILKGSGSSYLFYMNLVYNTTTQVNEMSNSEINIYPNPVQDILTINSPSIVNRVDIYNIEGKFVKTIKLNSNTACVGNLKSGLYLITIYSNTEVFHKQFLKK